MGSVELRKTQSYPDEVMEEDTADQITLKRQKSFKYVQFSLFILLALHPYFFIRSTDI